jgi:hypothetical protein
MLRANLPIATPTEKIRRTGNVEQQNLTAELLAQHLLTPPEQQDDETILPPPTSSLL